MKWNAAFALLCCLPAQAQIHWLINKDANADCAFIRNGTFVQHGTEIDPKTGSHRVPGYKLVFDGDRSTEYVERTNNRIECSITFDGPCTYRSTVTHVEHPYGVVRPGLVIITEILETAIVDSLIMIRGKNYGDEEWQTFVLERIK